MADPPNGSQTGTGGSARPPRSRRALGSARAGARSRPGRHRTRTRPAPVLTVTRRVIAGRRPGDLSPGPASGSRRPCRYCATRSSRPRSNPHPRSGGTSHSSGALAPGCAASRVRLASVQSTPRVSQPSPRARAGSSAAEGPRLRRTARLDPGPPVLVPTPMPAGAARVDGHAGPAGRYPSFLPGARMRAGARADGAGPERARSGTLGRAGRIIAGRRPPRRAC